MKKFIVLLIAMLFTFSLYGCSSTPKDSNQADKAAADNSQAQGKITYIKANGTGVSGLHYAMMVGLSDLLNKKIPDVKASPGTSAGDLENINLLDQGKIQLAPAKGVIAYEALTGAGQYNGQKGKDIYALGTFNNSFENVFALKSANVNKASDLKGKRIGLGPKGGFSFIAGEMWLQSHGIDPVKDIKPFYVKEGEMVEMLKDGQLDAGMWQAGIGIGSLQDLTSTKDIVFIEPEEAAVKKMLERWPSGSIGILPANSYKGQDKDVKMFETRNILLVTGQLDDKMVYEITKNMWDNMDYLQGVSVGWKDVTWEKGLDGISIPLHPGALKYYQEKNHPGLQKLKDATKNVTKKS